MLSVEKTGFLEPMSLARMAFSSFSWSSRFDMDLNFSIKYKLIFSSAPLYQTQRQQLILGVKARVDERKRMMFYCVWRSCFNNEVEINWG